MVVIAYDITDDKRLQRVAKYMEKFGIRTQKSVFELDIPFSEGKKIVDGMVKIIDPKEDKVFLFQIKGKEDVQGNTSIDRIL